LLIRYISNRKDRFLFTRISTDCFAADEKLGQAVPLINDKLMYSFDILQIASSFLLAMTVRDRSCEDGKKEAGHQFLILAEILTRLLLAILTLQKNDPSLRPRGTKREAICLKFQNL
jgi:hypothetical protein